MQLEMYLHQTDIQKFHNRNIYVAKIPWFS